MFKIDSLTIKRNKKASKILYKNLKPGLYPFHSINISDLWGEHVNIQAIVGKNGSGKSSLMDLLYMAVNNFAYMFERGHHRAAATSLCYVRGLFVDIQYTLNGKQYILRCEGDSTQIIDISEKKLVADFYLNRQNASEEEIEDYEIQNFVKEFFYTIVSNYSMQSFISSNYTCGICIYNREEHKDDEPENVNSFGLSWIDDRDRENDSKEKIWLNSIFHKNDGYVRSITLNPYRDNGVINMEKEKKLARYRLIALLIDGEKSKTNIFRDYALDRITFSLDTDFILRKFPKESIIDLIETVKNQVEDENSDLSKIIESFNLEIDSQPTKSQLIALAYLQRKMDKVIESYETYKLYRADKEFSVYDTNDKIRKKHLKKLCQQIKKDPSHIVTKIKQTVNFLSCEKNRSFVENSSFPKKWLDSTFTYRRYAKHYVRSYLSLDEIITNFPPPIFKYEIFLNKIVLNDADKYKKNKKYLGVKTINDVKRMQNLSKGTYFISANAGKMKTIREREERINQGVIVRWNGENWKKDEINLSMLSSGELQMMHTLSTHAYHIRNIMSVKRDAIKYHNINMVFDEVEICFHPEYQRQFISRLLAMLNALCRIKRNYNFNIFILTHSPFILSDVPSSNTLYMDNGKAINVESESFGQNISDLLNQNFFLDSFVGDFSAKKINSLIDFLLNKKRNLGWTEESARRFMEIIGDEFLKRNLIKKYKEVFKGKNV